MLVTSQQLSRECGDAGLARTKRNFTGKEKPKAWEEGKQGRLTWPAGSQRLGATRVVREEDGQLHRGGPGAGGEAEKSPVQFRGTKSCVVGMANSLLSPLRASSVQHPLLSDGREQ